MENHKSLVYRIEMKEWGRQTDEVLWWLAWVGGSALTWPRCCPGRWSGGGTGPRTPAAGREREPQRLAPSRLQSDGFAFIQ